MRGEINCKSKQKLTRKKSKPSFINVFGKGLQECFIRISKHREVGRKNETQPSLFNRLRGVWILDETLFRVFDMASQTIHNSWGNSK